MSGKQHHKFITLLSLYIAQSVPMSFFSTVVPVIMRQEQYSLESIGLLQLIKLPWILKFLWAPLVDKTSLSLKGYSRWILGSELFYALVILSVGFLNLQTNFILIVVLMVIAITASATQDIATDALSVLLLKKGGRAWGNTMQALGGFAGSLLGSGVLLLVYHYMGWQALMIALAGFVLLALLPLYIFKLKNTSIEKKNVDPMSGSTSVSFADIFSFFRQKGISTQVIFLVLYNSGLIGILSMLKPFLVDMGYTIEQIGVMSGLVGTAAAACCALFAGWMIKRAGLQRCTVSIGVLILLVPVCFLWIALGHTSTQWLYMGIVLLWGIYGMATVVLYTLSMNYCVRNGREGTDFTIQTVLTQVSGLLFAVISGKLADALTYKGLFVVEILFAVLSLVYVWLFYCRKQNSQTFIV